MGFDAHVIAKEIVVLVKPLIDRVREHDSDLARQLRRAAQSMILNIGEGSRRLGRDRAHHYTIADGSARETLDAIGVAEAWAYLGADETEAVRALLDRELAVLWRLTHRK